VLTNLENLVETLLVMQELVLEQWAEVLVVLVVALILVLVLD
jgi:hypothetical protein